MSSIKLSWDATKGLFSFPIMIVRKSPTVPGMRKDLSANTVMYVDTGSSLTSITDDEATKLEIDVQQLPTEKIGGIGGRTPTHIINGLSILSRTSNGVINVQLAKIAVLPSKIVDKREKKRGVFKEVHNYEVKMVCLCGLDLLEALRGSLSLDLVNKSGYITVP